MYIYIQRERERAKSIKKWNWKIFILKLFCGKIYSSYMKYKTMISKHLDISPVFLTMSVH